MQTATTGNLSQMNRATTAAMTRKTMAMSLIGKAREMSLMAVRSGMSPRLARSGPIEPER